MAENVSLALPAVRSELALQRQRMEADSAGRARMVAGAKLTLKRRHALVLSPTSQPGVRYVACKVPVARMVCRSGLSLGALLTALLRHQRLLPGRTRARHGWDVHGVADPFATYCDHEG
jgi:hypothetical protein